MLALAEHFLEDYSRKARRKSPKMTPAAQGAKNSSTRPATCTNCGT